MGRHAFLEQLINCGWEMAEIEILIVVEHIVLAVLSQQGRKIHLVKQQACTHYPQEIPCFSP